MQTNGRKLKLLVDGSPKNFAIHNISEGGIMGEQVSDMLPGSHVHVRFEGGVVVPAVVKWADDGLIGLAFVEPILLDRSEQSKN